MMTRTEAYLTLNLLPKIGPIRVRRLLEAFETPEEVLKASVSKIIQIDGFGADLAETVANWESKVDLVRELRRIRYNAASGSVCENRMLSVAGKPFGEKNAARALNAAEQNHTDNPLTYVHELVAYLQDIKNLY